MDYSISSIILAIWNILLVLLILYAPGLISLFVSIVCFICKKKIPGIIMITIAVLFFIVSTLILYFVFDWIFIGNVFTIFDFYNF